MGVGLAGGEGVSSQLGARLQPPPYLLLLVVLGDGVEQLWDLLVQLNLVAIPGQLHGLGLGNLQLELLGQLVMLNLLHCYLEVSLRSLTEMKAVLRIFWASCTVLDHLVCCWPSRSRSA